MTTIQVFRRNNGKFYYRIIADTGHNIISSDGYAKKADCFHAVQETQKQILNEHNIQIEPVGKDEYMFKITGSDNSIVGYSMPFHNKKQCEKWIKILQKYLPDSAVEELTSV